jgi:hypothetical protein
MAIRKTSPSSTAAPVKSAAKKASPAKATLPSKNASSKPPSAAKPALAKKAPASKKAAPTRPAPAAKKAAPARKKPPAPTPKLPPSVSLDSLVKELGPSIDELTTRTFEDVLEEDLVADGTQIDSQTLIDDAPVFVAAARDILASLTDAQRAKVRVPEGLFALLVAEATKLRELKRRHEADVARAAGGKAGREAELRAVMREGINERDLCYDSIRNALGSRRMGEVDALVGRADSPETLAHGLIALADFLDTTYALSDRDAVRLDDYGADHACAESLRALASKVRETSKESATPARRVSQRGLDLQDGRVVLLIEKVLRAFRSARRTDPAILVPALPRAGWMFESRSTRRSAPATRKEPAPPPPPEVKDDGEEEEPEAGDDGDR